RRQAIGLDVLMMEEVSLEGAVAPGDLKVGHLGIAVLVQVSEALAVGRKGDGAVHVFNEQARSSAEHGSVVERGDGLLGVVAADAVDVVAVGREGEAAVTRSG